MPRVVERVRQVTVALLIVLVLVPAALHGHDHGRAGEPRSGCVICLATHHTPGVQAVPFVVPAVVGPSIELVARSIPAPATAAPHPHAGRGPPLFGVTPIA